MAYATFDFYKDVYFGNSITEDNFPRVSERASEYLDFLTFNRINAETLEKYSTKVQKACCAIAEFINDIDSYNASTLSSSDSRPVASKTVGSISVTYTSGVSYVESYVKDSSKIDTHIYELANRYLSDTALLSGIAPKVCIKR